MARGISALVCAGVIAFAPATGIAQQPATAIARLHAEGGANAVPGIAADGSTVAVAWGVSSSSKGSDVVVAVSRDAGRTFGAPVRANRVRGEVQLGSERPPRVALVRRPGAVDIAVLWTARDASGTSLKMARSTDGGRTFQAPAVVQKAGAPGNRGWASMTVDESGTLHVIWLDHRGSAEEHQHAGAAEAPAAHDGVAMAQRSGLYYAAIGNGPIGERELTRGVCYCCKTAVATGPGGLIASAWRHVYPGNMRDIALTLSRDGGRSFSSPARVSEDRWSIDGCPEDGPAIAIDATGLVHIVWPTVLAGPDPEGALFYATTRDGRSFTPRQRVPTLGGPKPEHPQLVLGRDGAVVVAWDELFRGQRVAAQRLIARDLRGGVTFGAVQRIGDGSAARLPMLAASGDSIVAAWTAGEGERSFIAVTRTTR